MAITRLAGVLFMFCVCAFAQARAEPRVLFLIIANDFEQHVAGMQNVWRAYMNTDPDHVEAYFIKGSPHLNQETKLVHDTIYAKTAENLVPGCMNKTMMAMQYLEPRLSEFDYVIRTNLSSFFIFSRLFAFLETLPKTHCYCGGPLGWPHYASGAGIIFSPDIVQLMVDHSDEFMDTGPIDDQLISQVLIKYGVPLVPAQQLYIGSLEQWNAQKDAIPDDLFHFRTKNDNPALRYPDDITIQAELLKMFYNIDFDVIHMRIPRV